MWRGIVCVASVSLAIGCGADEPTGIDLAVDVRTDAVPVVSFAAVRVERVDTDGTVIERSEVTVSPGDAYSEGVRIAEFHGLPEGGVGLHVALLDAAGGVRVVRKMQFYVDTTRVVLVVVGPSCGACPRPGDDPAFTTCCLDPGCSADPACTVEPVCRVDSDCDTYCGVAGRGLCHYGDSCLCAAP